MAKKLTRPSIEKLIKEALKPKFVHERGERSDGTILYHVPCEKIYFSDLKKLEENPKFEITYINNQFISDCPVVHLNYNHNRK